MNIGFIGLGLIGGSIAKALKQANSLNYIKAYDYYVEKDINSHNPNLIQAKNDEILDDICYTLSDFSDCDIIFLCAPVRTNIKYLKQLKNVVKKECIITDVGSVKGDIHKAAKEENMLDLFVGGHPMAGSEKSGYSNCSIQILENAYYIVTSSSETPSHKVEFLYNLISEIGAIPIKLNYLKHDEYVAAISHVPHLIAVCLVNMVRENDTEGVMKLIAAGGFKDITRIGSSSPVMWENICINNKDAILDYLSKYRELIDKAYSYVAENDRKAIYNIFETSKEYRDSISNSSAKTITSFYEIYVDVSDTKGIIARIAKILADNDINLKNIGIVNNREFENGALRVEFKEEKEYNKAIDTLKKEGFKVY